MSRAPYPTVTAHVVDEDHVHIGGSMFARGRACTNMWGSYNDVWHMCENGFQCSVCKGIVEDCEGYRVIGTWNYCPNCGARVIND